MQNIPSLIQDKINNLWKKFSDLDICKIPPIASHGIPDKGIVFMGINPSLSEDERKRLFSKEEKKCEFYKLSYDENTDYRYFKKFFEVARQTGLDWGHLDLLYCRETNQNKVKALLKTERGKDFLYQQCMITKSVLNKIIDKNKPRIFVITNTFARDLLGRYRKSHEPKIEEEWWVDFDFVWNDGLGTYVYNNNPFFFTSMLTGQRALDNGSFERLVWHINLVKKKLSIS
jgi:hypothetical protein